MPWIASDYVLPAVVGKPTLTLNGIGAANVETIFRNEGTSTSVIAASTGQAESTVARVLGE
jgi:hypothetical protein